MKSARLAPVLLVLAGLGLASCGESAPEPAEASPEAPAGISVADGRLVLPAVSGNPGAVYFDISNNGAGDTSIVGAFVDGAKSAMLHMTSTDGEVNSMVEMADVALPDGQTVNFARGGNHVMAMELDPSLAAGGTTEVTLTFADGDKVSFPAQILAPGEAR